MSDKNNAVTLKEWANIAIAKHTRKTFKYEAGVLQDQDPEDLHQMRVGMRRLRSAISGFAVALDLPKTVTDKNIAKIGHSLGNLRDLDVLLAILKDDYRPLLTTAEQKSLDKVLKSLKKQRKEALKQVRKTLNSKLYLNLQQGLQNWLKQPQYKSISNLSIYPALPDLLLPQISQLLLHPGWLVGVELENGQIQLPEMSNVEAVEQLLEREESILHDLRKEAKRTRYNLELFSQFYDETYGYYLEQIEKIQEVLGHIQDCYVLRQVLEKIFQSAIAEQMPELAEILRQARSQKWLEWQILQQQFLEDKTRMELRQAIQQPL
ncbi:MAG TPA: CHAD domain-containing protein [Coleofasciculaceae cyanobacterium]|jgi:CHAD domain-containing protein